jgi:hypothetical protein
MASSRSVKFALLGAALCAVCAAASCSQDGVTTNCPALPLYQTFPLGDASPPDAMSGETEASQEALAAAIKAGCATGPNGETGSTAGSSGQGGSGGAGGGGKGGSAGKGGTSGTSSADNAGAAGRN